MSKIDELLEDTVKNDPDLREYSEKVGRQLEFAVAVRKLRDQHNLTQREFAKLVDKPQSTIVRIENGNMSPNIKTLEELGKPFNKSVKIEYV